ncbi:hypothetical protein BLL36_22425 [Pseudomonas cedrina subsp. cedrina]|uniref:Uncharacterized protein n=1 Tax=Pseudomonas cedrina subsp. cedrina TaxID=76762 RepID=A0A1V2K2N2_PSECE|nr:hypothetical protein BLL36_22425 [Pseudomonas cedrina subsp. cedrina]
MNAALSIAGLTTATSTSSPVNAIAATAIGQALRGESTIHNARAISATPASVANNCTCSIPCACIIDRSSALSHSSFGTSPW